MATRAGDGSAPSRISERRAAARDRSGGAYTRRRAEIVAAADERDALADARDLSAEQHEHGLDLAHFLAAEADDYGYDWPERRAAALDREHARQDRIAARGDLTALVRMFAQTAEPAGLGASWQGPGSVALDGA